MTDSAHYHHLFGPVPSRRLGRSLGIDLTPLKTCSLDCVFCQLGRTTHQTLDRKAFYPTEDIIAEIAHWLTNGGHADYLTLSGSGEPTLHARFGEVLRFLRDQPMPSVLLTNGTLLDQPAVRESAALAHVVKVSLSAWDQMSFEWINRPHRQLTFQSFFHGLKQFRDGFDGQLWLEVFLLSGLNAMRGQVEKIAALSRELAPERIHLNTIARPPAEDFAVAVPISQLEDLCSLFDPPACIAVDTVTSRSPAVIANQSAILALLKRRPCTNRQIQTAFGLHINEVSKTLGRLIQRNLIRTDVRNNEIYYRSA